MANNLLSSPLSGSSSPRGPISKPFSNVQRGSNLSPYLNIGGIPTGALPNYYSLVKPQLQQQRQQQREQRSQATQQREITRLQQLQAQAAQAPFNVQGDPNIAPTGHAAVFQNTAGRFQNYGGYYQQPR